MSPQFGEFERLMANDPGSSVSMTCTIGWHGVACVEAAREARSLVPCSCTCHEVRR